MDPIVGAGIKDRQLQKSMGALRPMLLEGEEVLALVQTASFRPAVHLLAVTNARVLALTSAGEVKVNEKRSGLSEVKVDGAVTFTSGTSGEKVKLKLLGKGDRDLVQEILGSAPDDLDGDAGELAETIRGKVSRTDRAAIEKLSRAGGKPWLVLSGHIGFLAAWEDRLVIAKDAGPLASRAATFYYRDISAVEAHFTLGNGVLEVIAPGYEGSSARRLTKIHGKDGILAQANVLPVTEKQYQSWTDVVRQLQERISRAKTTQPVPGPPAATDRATQTSSSGDLVTRLRELGELRGQGLLTEEEFTAAKARLLAGD